MRKLLFLSIALSSLGMAQVGFNNVQQTTGGVGLAAGQTARLTIYYATAPAPILQIACSASLTIADDDRRNAKNSVVSQLQGGSSASVELNADTDLGGAARTQIHAWSIAPTGCHLVTTLEIIDNITQKTVLVVGSEQTYPPPSPRTTVTP